MGNSFRYCIHCKKLVRKGVLYCPECSKSLMTDDEGEKVKCSYCQIVINKNQKYCQFCGTEVKKEGKEYDTSKKCELPSFMSLGGNIFEEGTRVFVTIRDTKIILRTLLKGTVEYDINDFTYCRSLPLLDFNKTGDGYVHSSLRDIVTLKFNNDKIHFKRDDDTEKIIVLLYKLIQNQVYEKHDMFLNTENRLFDAEI